MTFERRARTLRCASRDAVRPSFSEPVICAFAVRSAEAMVSSVLSGVSGRHRAVGTVAIRSGDRLSSSNTRRWPTMTWRGCFRHILWYINDLTRAKINPSVRPCFLDRSCLRITGAPSGGDHGQSARTADHPPLSNYGCTLGGGPWAKCANGRSSSRRTSAPSSSKCAWAENSNRNQAHGTRTEPFPKAMFLKSNVSAGPGPAPPPAQHYFPTEE
jgi:hypothetical protein